MTLSALILAAVVTMLTAPWGWDYKADEVIGRTNKDGIELPCLIGYDKNGKKFKTTLKCKKIT